MLPLDISVCVFYDLVKVFEKYGQCRSPARPVLFLFVYLKLSMHQRSFGLQSDFYTVTTRLELTAGNV